MSSPLVSAPLPSTDDSLTPTSTINSADDPEEQHKKSTLDDADDSDHASEEDVSTVLDRLVYRAAIPGDVDALRELFDGALVKQYPANFYSDLCTGLASGSSSAPAIESTGGVMRLSAHLVDDSGYLAGAVVIASMSLAKARESQRLPVDIIDGAPLDTTAACVLIIAVGERYRRLGIGSNLMTAGLAAVALPNPSLRVVFLHSRASDESSAAFYDANDFSRLGALPEHYSDSGSRGGSGGGDAQREDALLWVRPLRDVALAEFDGPRTTSGDVNLTHPGVQRTTKMPWWLRDLLFHFILPFTGVAVLFGICYLLVVLGPLKGISGLGGGGEDAAAVRKKDL